MIFTDNTLQNKLEVFYFSEYLKILEDRKNRKDLALTTFLDGLELPNKPFERNLRNFLNNLGTTLHESTLAVINEKLLPNNCIAIDDPKEQDYVNAIEKRNQFVWPDANELAIRENEKNQLLNFMNTNPTDIKSNLSIDEFKRSLYLKANI